MSAYWESLLTMSTLKNVDLSLEKKKESYGRHSKLTWYSHIHSNYCILLIRTTEENVLKFTLSWKESTLKYKCICKTVNDKVQFFEHLKSFQMYLPEVETSFECKSSHKWIWHYDNYLPLELKDYSKSEMITIKDIRNSAPLDLLKSDNKILSKTVQMRRMYINSNLKLRRKEYSKQL